MNKILKVNWNAGWLAEVTMYGHRHPARLEYSLCCIPFRKYSMGSGATNKSSQMVPVVKNPPANAAVTGDKSSIPGLGRSPEGGHGNRLPFSCLWNPTDRGAWWASVHMVAESRLLKDLVAKYLLGSTEMRSYVKELNLTIK